MHPGEKCAKNAITRKKPFFFKECSDPCSASKKTFFLKYFKRKVEIRSQANDLDHLEPYSVCEYLILTLFLDWTPQSIWQISAPVAYPPSATWDIQEWMMNLIHFGVIFPRYQIWKTKDMKTTKYTCRDILSLLHLTWWCNIIRTVVLYSNISAN